MKRKLLFIAGAFSLFFCAQAQTVFKTPQEAVKYYEELVGTLAGQVRNLQDENAKLGGAVQNLQLQLEAIARNNEMLTRDIADLRRQIAADSEKREKQLGKLADRLKAAANTPAKNSKTAPTVTEYEIYVVQRGATLTAISKAYGVSVDAIRKANNMTSDVLRVGQSLKIPRK